MSNLREPKTNWLSALQLNFDVTIEKRNYDIKNLIMMQKARGLFGPLEYWTCGEEECLPAETLYFLLRNITLKSNHLVLKQKTF